MSTILVDNLTGKTSAGSITVTSEGGAATQSLQQGLAKAWSNFKGNSNAIDDSLNISIITDRGTGSMYGNYTNSIMNYTVMGASSPEPSGSMTSTNSNRSTIASADTASRYSMNVYTDDTACKAR
jgi:hypothetical protein